MCYGVTCISSDSDDDIFITKKGPSITQLKLEQSKLRTCLQATHELTSLQILQSEVTLIVKDPIITGEPLVNEPGTWREVTAECRIDLVPFSITFYTHKSNAKFGATSYRGLNVVLVKAAHETELSKSVLPTVVRPSDAVEVIRSYAEAYRSRRSTLARLATKYADSLYMEPLEDGGYLLKCANLLQMAWRLENRWSPLSPFHHRMKFDIEYMEEKYITIITQCHKQLSDPTISSDERTLLLSKIIATCLEANPISESAESDQDAGPPKRRATLDQEIEEPENKRKREVMAPPKSLPKKAKVSKTTQNSRCNDNSSGNTATGENRQADKENVDNNVAGDRSVPVENTGSRESVSNVAKSSQKPVGKTLKQTKNTESAIDENISTEIVPNITTKTKNLKQNKILEKESQNTGKIIEPQTSKNIENKKKTKKVTKNAATVSSKKSNDATAAKNNQLKEEISNINNQKGAVVENIAKTVDTEKISNKKINKPSKPKSDGNKNNANENIRSATTTKPVQTNKKAIKENTNIRNNKREQTAFKAIEKEQTTGSTQKVVEKNANNKIKDNIVDISKKVKSIDSVNNKISTNKVVDKNDDTIKRKATSESNDVPVKTKRSTITEKKSDNVAIVKNKISSNKTPDINSDVINQKSIKTKDDASTKTKNSNSDNNINKKPVASDINKITTAHTTNNAPKNLIEKDRVNNPNTKSQGKTNDDNEGAKKSNTKKPVLPFRMQNNLKMARKSIGNIKVVAAKENGAKIKSKIPRHVASTFNRTSSLTKQTVQKINTHVPRLAKPK